jgi:hypothetical protein
MEDYRCWNKHG